MTLTTMSTTAMTMTIRDTIATMGTATPTGTATPMTTLTTTAMGGSDLTVIVPGRRSGR